MNRRSSRTSDAGESRTLEFKELFEPTPQGWCEVMKDMVALANTDGGKIVFGLTDDGKPSGWDPGPVLALDHADIVNQVARYTGVDFDNFEILEEAVDASRVAVLIIRPAEHLLVFVKPGAYQVGEFHKTAFAKGTVYVRHGAKSEPATSNDLRRAVDRRVNQVKKSWMGNIRKVIEAPHGSAVVMRTNSITAARVVNTPDAPTARLTNDPKSAYALLDPNATHPYRQKDVIERLNRQLGSKLNQHDMRAVKKIYEVNESKPEWFYKPRFGTPQFSEAFVNWLLSQAGKDATFFMAARARLKILSEK